MKICKYVGIYLFVCVFAAVHAISQFFLRTFRVCFEAFQHQSSRRLDVDGEMPCQCLTGMRFLALLELAGAISSIYMRTIAAWLDCTNVHVCMYVCKHGYTVGWMRLFASSCADITCSLLLLLLPTFRCDVILTISQVFPHYTKSCCLFFSKRTTPLKFLPFTSLRVGWKVVHACGKTFQWTVQTFCRWYWRGKAVGHEKLHTIFESVYVYAYVCGRTLLVNLKILV